MITVEGPTIYYWRYYWLPLYYIVYPSGIFDPDVEHVAILSNT